MDARLVQQPCQAQAREPWRALAAKSPEACHAVAAVICY
jgi:hypothetical protein